MSTREEMGRSGREWQDGFVYVIDDEGTGSWQRKEFPETS